MEIVAHEQRDGLAVAVRHLPHAHIGMVDGNVAALPEAEAEKPLRGVERRRDHVVQLEVGLQRRPVDAELGHAALFGVMEPIPGRQGLVVAFRLGHLFERRPLLVGPSPCAAPNLIEKIARLSGRLGHRVVDLIIGVCLEPEELRKLRPESEDFPNERPVIRGPCLLAARHVSLIRFLAQIAPLGELQERLDARPRKGNDVLPGKPRSRAACAAAWRTKSGNPFKSSSPSRTSWNDFSAASTFCAKPVCSWDSRAPISVMRAFPASSRRAPARTNRL